MVKNHKMTPAEWDLMEAIWTLGGAPSIRDVWEHCYPNGEKAYTTVQTIMNTLEKKGHLTREKIGLVHFYSPVKTRAEMVRVEMKSVVSRVFDGSIPALANYLINSESLSLEEIESIKELLREKERKLRSAKS